MSIRKSPVRIRAETVSIRKSREHKGRDPQHKKKYHALSLSLLCRITPHSNYETFAFEPTSWQMRCTQTEVDLPRCCRKDGADGDGDECDADDDDGDDDDDDADVDYDPDAAAYVDDDGG